MDPPEERKPAPRLSKLPSVSVPEFVRMGWLPPPELYPRNSVRYPVLGRKFLTHADMVHPTVEEIFTPTEPSVNMWVVPVMYAALPIRPCPAATEAPF